ncbi:uncharacterized protein LY79DRAFT_580672 [Colletotrichum navitas]|uniref:Uncharacterized protein n=1 Tax=Colletotrichum navitas TaxID=681940 RepID=A0AAD8PXK1_9PEZI|nr:uncharacterized protein LY79DRAFT_580672 [Colletotrichum navitas]KAK1586018.1 hypothetical protein LY79DRAFT_580672 [Colletotrichum navitas]
MAIAPSPQNASDLQRLASARTPSGRRTALTLDDGLVLLLLQPARPARACASSRAVRPPGAVRIRGGSHYRNRAEAAAAAAAAAAVPAAVPAAVAATTTTTFNQGSRTSLACLQFPAGPEQRRAG